MLTKKEIKIYEIGFQDGKHKCQQELALTWEKVEILYECIIRAWSIRGGPTPARQEVYELALKFFNEGNKFK